MKKLVIMGVALSLVLSMVQMTTADDRLKLFGEARIRAFDVDNDANSARTANDRYVDGFSNDARYVDSRLRFGMAISVTEGVTANLRMDLHDDNVWGGDGKNTQADIFGRPKTVDKAINIDRMYIQVDNDLLRFQGGQIFQPFGPYHVESAYAPQNIGMALRLKFPVQIDLNYFKLDERDGTFDDTDDEKDIDLYAMQLQYKSDLFTIGTYGGAITDDSDKKYTPSVAGFWGQTSIGMLNLTATIDTFGGTKDTETDYMGTQAYLNGEVAAAGTLNIGLNLYYALAAEEDGSEEQLTSLPEKFGGFEPHEYGLQTLDDGLNPCGNNTPFDLERVGAGTVGFDIYANITIMEKITLAAQAGYAVPEDKDSASNPDLNGDLWENTAYLEGSINYIFSPQCSLVGGVYFRNVTYKNEDVEPPMGFGALMEIAW